MINKRLKIGVCIFAVLFVFDVSLASNVIYDKKSESLPQSDNVADWGNTGIERPDYRESRHYNRGTVYSKSIIYSNIDNDSNNNSSSSDSSNNSKINNDNAALKQFYDYYRNLGYTDAQITEALCKAIVDYLRQQEVSE